MKAHKKFGFWGVLVGFAALVSLRAVLAQTASPYPPDFTSQISEALFPQSASWPLLSDLPVTHKNQLNAALLAKITRDANQQCSSDWSITGAPTAQILSYTIPDTLHVGDFFGPGDDDVIIVHGLDCAEGTYTSVWRHVHTPAKTTYLSIPFIVLRLEKSATPRFLATDDGNEGANVLASYFIGADFSISELPTDALFAPDALVVPKAARIISGEMTLDRDIMLLWKPESVDMNDPITRRLAG